MTHFNDDIVELVTEYHDCATKGCPSICSIHSHICEMCEDQAEADRYYKRETKDWDGKSWLYSEEFNEFFRDMDELIEFLEEYEIESETDPRLVECRRCNFPVFDFQDFIHDQHSEVQHNPSNALVEAAKAFEEALDAEVHDLWEPGQFAIRWQRE